MRRLRRRKQPLLSPLDGRGFKPRRLARGMRVGRAPASTLQPGPRNAPATAALAQPAAPRVRFPAQAAAAATNGAAARGPSVASGGGLAPARSRSCASSGSTASPRRSIGLPTASVYGPAPLARNTNRTGRYANCRVGAGASTMPLRRRHSCAVTGCAKRASFAGTPSIAVVPALRIHAGNRQSRRGDPVVALPVLQGDIRGRGRGAERDAHGIDRQRRRQAIRIAHHPGIARRAVGRSTTGEPACNQRGAAGAGVDGMRAVGTASPAALKTCRSPNAGSCNAANTASSGSNCHARAVAAGLQRPARGVIVGGLRPGDARSEQDDKQDEQENRQMARMRMSSIALPGAEHPVAAA